MEEEVKVGDVWFVKSNKKPVCIISIHASQKLVFVCGLDDGYHVFTFKDLRENCYRGEGWSRASLFEGIIRSH